MKKHFIYFCTLIFFVWANELLCLQNSSDISKETIKIIKKTKENSAKSNSLQEEPKTKLKRLKEFALKNKKNLVIATIIATALIGGLIYKSTRTPKIEMHRPYNSRSTRIGAYLYGDDIEGDELGVDEAISTGMQSLVSKGIISESNRDAEEDWQKKLSKAASFVQLDILHSKPIFERMPTEKKILANKAIDKFNQLYKHLNEDTFANMNVERYKKTKELGEEVIKAVDSVENFANKQKN